MISASQAVHTSTLIEGSLLPLVVTPSAADVDLSDWVQSNREQVNQWVVEHGGVLFRSFGINSPDKFRSVMRAGCNELMIYKERSSPRTLVQEHVYTSTDYPADQGIFPHNEHSYANRFPMRIAFCCVVSAISGGETPIVDCRRVTARIPPSIRSSFQRRGGWMYVRTLSDEIGLSWQTVYQTSERNLVEEYCRQNDTQWEWKSNNRLRTSQVRPVTARHPQTGEEIWFNHATFFNVNTLPEMLRDFLLQQFAVEDLPNNTYYGDGTPIEADTLRTLQQAYLTARISFPWERGDVLLLDNMLTAHGRSPFEGDREVLVIMGDPIERRSLPE